MSNVPLKLSEVKPDFESLVLQLQLFLDVRETWKDLLTSSTGQTLIEMMAATGTFNQFAIESAAREAYLSTAVRDSSIYAITRMLGVRISRKAPASTSVDLHRESDQSVPLLIPKFSQFLVNGKFFFNRYPILFPVGEEDTTATLYEGQIRSQTFDADSTLFKEIYLNEPGFSVADQDVEVAVIDPTTNIREVWTVTDQGIWTAGSNDKVYYDSTSGLGDTILQFGDGYHGFLPSLGSKIEVRYAITTGSIGNNGGSDLAVSIDAYPEITGTTTSAITGGANEKPASFYKILAPHLFRARSRAVTPQDYKAIASSYSDVASVTIQAQKDIAPNDLRWMNVVRVCILPFSSDAFTEQQWDDFILWFQKYYHAAIHISKYDATKIVSDVTLELSLTQDAIPEEVIPQVDENIRSLFERDFRTLGKRIAVSDISNACTSVKGVDYVNIETPKEDLVPNTLSYYELGTLTITTKYSERVFYPLEQ